MGLSSRRQIDAAGSMIVERFVPLMSGFNNERAANVTPNDSIEFAINYSNKVYHTKLPAYFI